VPVPFLKLVVNNMRDPPDDPPRTAGLPRRPQRREECEVADVCPRCGGVVHFVQDAEGDLTCPECRAEVAYHYETDTWVVYDQRAPEAEYAANASLLPEVVFRRCRPCVYVSCPHNNYLSINEASGKIKLTCPEREPWDMAPDDSCSLDVADLGPQTLERVGSIMGLTRERTRQIEKLAVTRLQHTLAKHSSEIERELDLTELRKLLQEATREFAPRYWRRDR